MTDRGVFSGSRAPSTDTQIDVRAAAIEAIPVSPTTKVRPSELSATEATHYRVLEQMHRGGMGEILRAKLTTATGFSRQVVLKGLLSGLSEDNVSHDLFMREAHLMAQLDHPNIVRVFDLPVLNDRPYLAMELVRGRNLHQVIQRCGTRGSGLPPLIALSVVSQALRGLHSAHCLRDDRGAPLGLVHRDVSPGNILVSFYGEVKVTDFGIAKLADSPKYTGPRSIRGKARYVAPEQVHGRPATVASDIYSAGVVLAEALMGAPLWERGSVPETLMAIVTEDRAEVLDRVLRDLPAVAGLRATLRKVLSRDPAQRPRSALHFAEILETIADHYGPRPTAVEMGQYLRGLFHDAEDLPRQDGFGPSGFAAPLLKDPLDDEDTTSATIVGYARHPPGRGPSAPPPVPPPSVPVDVGFARQGMASDRGDALEPRVMAHAIEDRAAVPAESEAFADPAERGPVLPLAPEVDDGKPTAAAGLGMLVTGIFVGASLAIVGGLMALFVG